MKVARLGLLLLLIGWSVPHSAGAAILRGRVLHGRAGIGGAVVVAASGRHRAVGKTGSDGAFRLSVPSGTYRLSSSAPGFRASIATGVNVRRSEVRDVVLSSSGLALTRAPIFGGGRSVVADGTPGVFYIAGDNIGDLYRTLDWGGTWTPVTVRRDDGAHGLGDLWGPGLLTTSGSPGEVAVCLFDGSTFYSTDYGVTWHALSGGPSTPGRILWGHAGATSVLAAGGDGHNYVADMSAPHPEFIRMTAPYVSSVSSPVGVANGADRPWLATVNGAGHLLVYPLLAQREAPSPAVDVPGFDAGGSEPPVYVALGGKSAPGEPPAGVMVAGLDWIAMSLKAPASHTYPSPSAIGVGLNLNGHPGGLPCFTTSPPGGYPSLTPNTSEVYGAGWVNGCWVQDRSGTLTVERGLGAGAAIDAGYNTSDTASGGDAVVMEEPLAPDMSSGGEIGVAKLAATTDGFPNPLTDRTGIARSGLLATSSGIAETGIDAGTVHQTIAIPGGVAAASDVGGAASDDGGHTFQRTTLGNTWAVASWQGASGRWLLFGQNAFGANHNLVAAFIDWTHTTAPAAGGNVSGSTAADFAGRVVPPGVVHVDAIAGVPGQDRAFVGATYDGTLQNGPPEAALVRVSLGAGPAFADRTPIGSDVITKPGPIAYCPTAGSAAPSGDVLMVISEDYYGGGLFRVTDATGSPVVTEIRKFSGTGPGAGLPALRVDCASGTVWAASGDPGAGLLRSTDGGQTFTPVSVPGVGGDRALRAIGVAPGDPARITVGDTAGYLQASEDGGQTWTVVNDPTTDVNLAVPDGGVSGGGIWDVVLPPSPSGSASTDATRRSEPALGRDLIAGPGEFIGAPVTRAIPLVSTLRLTHQTFAVGSAHTVTTMRFSISRAATTSITIRRLRVGYRVGRRCVTASHARSRRATCTLAQLVSTLTRHARVGLNTIAFTGRLGRRGLQPGHYTVTVTARIGLGRSSRPRSAKFQVVRR